MWQAAESVGLSLARPAIRLLSSLGARREENIGQLRWSEVHDGTIHLSGKRTKNGEPHIIPLSAARSILAEVPRISASSFLPGKTPLELVVAGEAQAGRVGGPG